MVRLPGALAVFGKPAGAEAEPFDRQFPLRGKKRQAFRPVVRRWASR